MKPKIVKTYKEYQDLVSLYFTQKEYTNDYIQADVKYYISNNLLYEYHTNYNLFLFVEKEISDGNKGYRVYYYISNTDEIADFSELTNLVVEIIYRGDGYFPQAEIDYLCKCGFSINLIRDQYYGIYKDLTRSSDVDNIFVEYASNITEVENACNLFNSSFDVLSGDYIPERYHRQLLDNGLILIAKNKQGEFLGALHQKIDKGIAWISHLAVLPEARGMHVGQALLDIFVNNNYTSDKQRYMLWVQHQNNSAVMMYTKKGFRYLNKSTISLIK